MTKPWYQSKTYHGLAVILIGIIIGFLGGDVTSVVETQISEAVGGILSIIGVVLAARGRNKAEGRITLKKE